MLGATLEEPQDVQFELYVELLQRWGRKINLTSRRTEEEIVVYHFLDSLAALRLLGPDAAGRLLDIGTGAGFPGIPLKIVRPRIEVCLMGGSHKKMSFCREASRRRGAMERRRGNRAADRPRARWKRPFPHRC